MFFHEKMLVFTNIQLFRQHVFFTNVLRQHNNSLQFHIFKWMSMLMKRYVGDVSHLKYKFKLHQIKQINLGSHVK